MIVFSFVKFIYFLLYILIWEFKNRFGNLNNLFLEGGRKVIEGYKFVGIFFLGFIENYVNLYFVLVFFLGIEIKLLM